MASNWPTPVPERIRFHGALKHGPTGSRWPKAVGDDLLFLARTANVLIGPGVKLTYDDKQPALAVPFSRCFPNACFASGPLTDDAAKKLRARTEPGRIEYKDGNQKDVALAVSFNGFTTAFDAWQKE